MSGEKKGATDFVIELGVALHRFGAPAHRLESALTAVSRRLGLEGQFFSSPTQLHAAFGPIGQQATTLIRVDPGENNLEKLAALDALAGSVTRGKLAVEEGTAQVRQIVNAPPRYSPYLTVMAFALLSGAAAQFFGGAAYDLGVSCLIGSFIGLLAVLTSGGSSAARVFELLAAIVAAAIARIAAGLGLPVSAHIVTLAGLIVLIPGLTLTVAVAEIATRNLVSGTSRLSGAIVVFLEITFGVAIADTIAVRFLEPVSSGAPTALPPWTEPIALVLAACAITVLFRAHPRAVFGITIAATGAFYGARLGAWLLGPTLGASLGAFLVAGGSNVYARVADRPAMVPLVPGILLLVPGSLGFQSFSSMLQHDIVSGIDAAFAMGLAAISLVSGLLVANAVVSPRRNL